MGTHACDIITTYAVTSGPASEPLTIEELKDRLRVTGCDFDAELAILLQAARVQVEQDSYRKLMTQTVAMYMSDFPGSVGAIEIRLSPVTAITSIQYYDQNDALQTYSSASYYTDLTTTPPSVHLKQSYNWPSISQYKPNPVIVTMTAGYASKAAVPAAAKLAIVEHVKANWQGCEGNMATYQRLVSQLQWTAYHKVPA